MPYPGVVDCPGVAPGARAAHPGNSRTELFRNSPSWIRVGSQILGPPLSQSRDMGAHASPALGDLAPQTHCRESRFDGVRRAQMDPMLRRVVVELQQHVGVVDDLRDGLRELRAELNR